MLQKKQIVIIKQRVTRIEKRTINMATAGAGGETTQNEIGSDKTRLVSAEEGKHDEV